MDKHRNIFLVIAIVFAVSTIAVLIAFLNTYTELDRYKTETDVIVAGAVSEAKVAQKEEDTAHFFEEAKKPYASYSGLSDFGSIRFSYPKTWSVYNSQFNKDSYVVLFHSGIVPVASETTAMSLRVSVVNKPYEAVISEFEAKIVAGSLLGSPINVGQSDDFAGYEGVRFDGAINEKLNGSIVTLKLRDKTILLQVDAADWFEDFENIILPSFRYVE